SSYTVSSSLSLLFFFSFTPLAPTVIYTLSLHDALPISVVAESRPRSTAAATRRSRHTESPTPAEDRLLRAQKPHTAHSVRCAARTEEHTSELQSRGHLVCRLLLEKKKKKKKNMNEDKT